MEAVILAGGKGQRLRPYTSVIPKPLMPVGDMPILEILLRRLTRAGLKKAHLAVGHQAALLRAYFEDGARFGLSIDYTQEPQPLGTAGPLALVKDLPETFLVMNGDLLSDVDFAALLEEHHRSGALVTVGATRREHHVDLGVLHTDRHGRLLRYEEKPCLEYLVSMGIYAFSREALELLPSGERMDLPDLIGAAMDAGRVVNTYRHRGMWLDVGNMRDYQRANRMHEDCPTAFLPDETS